MDYLLEQDAKTVHRKKALTVDCGMLLSKSAAAGATKVRGLLRDGWQRCARCFGR